MGTESVATSTPPRERESRDRIPISVWAAAASTASMLIGWNWDISWHRSIGRDTTWTPAHVAIYLALAIAFVYNAILIIRATFGPDKHQPGIRILGFKGPSGAFVTLWAILLQFTSILFDDWWHGVYGLDNMVFSPPHFLLAFAISVFYFGQFLLVVRFRNRATEALKSRYDAIALFIWAMFLGHLLIGMDPQFGPFAVRSKAFLISCAFIMPFSLMLPHGYFQSKFAGMKAGLIYFVQILLFIWIFPFFPATPRFGPVFRDVTFLLPPSFPVLIFIPALLMSFVLARRIGRHPVITYLLVGATYVVVYTGVNFLTSEFLVSPLAENRIFMGGMPGSAFYDGYKPMKLLAWDSTSLWLVLIAIPFAANSAWNGVVVGRWLRKVQR